MVSSEISIICVCVADGNRSKYGVDAGVAFLMSMVSVKSVAGNVQFWACAIEAIPTFIGYFAVSSYAESCSRPFPAAYQFPKSVDVMVI